MNQNEEAEAQDASVRRLIERPKLKDLHPYSALLADAELDLANRRYDYALDRRERIAERTRFGSLAVNAASLAAVVSGLVGDSAKLGRLGLTDSDVREATALFLLGMILAAIAIWWSSIHFGQIASDQYTALESKRRRRALFELHATEAGNARLRAEYDATLATIADFKFSKWDIYLTNASGCAWLGALVGIAWRLAGLPVFWRL